TLASQVCIIAGPANPSPARYSFPSNILPSFNTSLLVTLMADVPTVGRHLLVPLGLSYPWSNPGSSTFEHTLHPWLSLPKQLPPRWPASFCSCCRLSPRI